MKKHAAAVMAGFVAVGASLMPSGEALPAPPSPPTVIVMVARAISACFSDTIRVNGFLVPREEALVTLDADGFRVAEILVAEGDRVTSGQQLVRLARLGDGSQDTTGPQRTTAPAASVRPPAQALMLRAPAAGVVTRSNALVGAVASPQAEPLFRIMVNGEIELEVDVPSIHVPKLRREANQTAHIEVENGTEMGGRVRLVPEEINRTTQLGRARLSIDQGAAVRAGMFARARIDASRSCGIAIPRSAVSYDADGTTVQVVQGTKVETRQVRTGLLSDTNVEIREGLKEGDVVIANAGGSLRNGDQVKPIFPEQPDR
jgi:multidrug efflux pump subunit AcrA (membrane-fusion protein)